ncbi:hypothetical protein LSAT2_018049, partial [Lamellibrachia satsuma]
MMLYRSLRLRVAKTFLKCSALIAKKPIYVYTSRIAERLCGSNVDGRAEGLPVIVYRILGSSR